MSLRYWLILSAPLLLAQDTVEHPPRPGRAGVTNAGRYDYGVMGPAASPAVVEAAAKAVAKPIPPGPFAPTWESLQSNYRTPSWFEDAKFGIFMHWGIFSVPAHHNEWYEKHMYSPAESQWHADHFGPQETFGYKDFIPLFTAAQWDPNAWAELFKKSGARLVIAMGQHHENFALWDSGVTPFNAKQMGPHRDLVGDLSKAVRAQNLRFGISNHGVENFTFIAPTHDLRTRLEAAHADLFDPKWAAFYNVADRSDPALTRFLTNWVDRNNELIDKYRPDMLWFDNGANLRVLDPLKLRIAAYYYNAAKQWNKEVSLGTKFNAYAPSNDDTKQIGSILDFEKVGPRSPSAIRPGPWMVDDSIGSNSWGYIEGLRIASPETIAGRLIDTVSKGGFYILNISPMANGIVPDDQQAVLLKIGQWLNTNGEAIYGTRPWTQFQEGTWHFTTKGDTLYAIAATWPGPEALIASLANTKIESVALLGSPVKLLFTQDAQGLKIKLPAEHVPSLAWSFKINIAKTTAYQNPIMPGDFSDLDVIRVGQDYYAISSTMQYSPGMAVLHSKDLVHWSIIGHAVPDTTQISSELKNGRGIWAGALRYRDGKFHVYFGTPDEGLFTTSATNPAGPWDPLKTVMSAKGWDDPCPFWDDDGQGYLVTTHFEREPENGKTYNIHLFKLTPDGTRILPEFDQILYQAKGSEANKLYKFNDTYYHLFSEVKPEGRMLMMRRAKSLEGPWEIKQLNHFSAANAREPNQGGLVQTPQGEWYFVTHLGKGQWEGRPGVLLPITWIDGWPIPGELGPDQPRNQTTLSASDGFDELTLKPEWEWTGQPRLDSWSLTARPGFLRLHSAINNMLTQRSLRAPHHEVIAKLDLQGMEPGQEAGLIHFAKTSCSLAAFASASTKVLSSNCQGIREEGPSIPSNNLWLRSEWNQDGVSHFSYSFDGQQFHTFGPNYQLTWAAYRGDRIGLFTSNSNTNSGYIDVDSFLYN